MNSFDYEKRNDALENDVKSENEEIAKSGDGNTPKPYGVAFSPAPDGSYRYTAYTPSDDDTNSSNAAVKKKGGKKKILLAALAILLCMTLSGCMGFAGMYVADRLLDRPTVTTDSGAAPAGSPGSSSGIQVSTPGNGVVNAPTSVERGDMMSYAETAAKVKDSVVEITTEATVQGGGFYPQYVTEGAGSGVIITADGYIATNNHVVDGAEKITVRMTDGTEFSASLIGADARTDLAVIKIDPAGRALCVAVFMADSSKLAVGAEVLAIGNPLGELGGTVTNGIISALEREVKISGSGTMTLLQTNAAVNPGNSGGGLFNLYGELVGIVNAKSSGDAIEGLGFAIPANTVRDIVAQLMEYGYVKGRPSINATMLDLDLYSAYRYFGSTTPGIYVIESNDAALAVGDRILSVEGTEMIESDDVLSIVEKYDIGDTVEVMLVRDRKTMTVSVTLSEYVPAASK